MIFMIFFSANINWIDYPTHVEARSIRQIAPNFGLSLDVETCEPPLLVVLELL